MTSLILTSSTPFDAYIDSLNVHLPDSHLTYLLRLFLNRSPPKPFGPKQREVVWNLHLYADSGGPIPPSPYAASEHNIPRCLCIRR